MKQKHKKIKIILLIFACFVVAGLGTALISFSVLYNKYNLDTEKLTSLNNGINVVSSDGTESVLCNSNRSIVQIDDLPDYVINAFVDTEDKRFFKHNGYDLKRIIKATGVNMTKKTKSQGASTISQQLIKNALLSNEKTYSRKLEEIILSIKMEKKFSKKEILQMYLNTIYFGSNAYGLENASKTYFNKPSKDLTLNQACCLAGLIKSPNKYSPKNNPENCNNRKNIVAKLMLDSNHITKQEYEQVLSSPVVLSNKNEFDHSYEEEAIIEACSLLNISERDLITKKYQITTFKDDNLQKHVMATSNSLLTSTEKQNDCELDSLSIVADNMGHVLAYYANSCYNLHNIKRQPASTLKPLAVYLPCFVHNILSPASQILDEEINIDGYSPQNADKKFHGYTSVRESLIHSYNVPAVLSLDYVGINKAKQILLDMGISTNNHDNNLTLALGNVYSGVKLTDLLTAYSCLANLGEKPSLAFVKFIKDKDGNVIYECEDYREKVLEKEDCFLLTDILKDVAKKGTAKRLESLSLPIASKTGTASVKGKNTDLYNISYTTNHTILNWVGNILEESVPNNIHSSALPTEMTKQICSFLYKSSIPKDFDKPEGVELCGFDLEELNKNHKLVEAKNTAERYIGYDYFKSTNKPHAFLDNKSKLEISLSKMGANISILNYNSNLSLVKEIDGNIELINDIEDNQYFDSKVFNYNTISYYLVNKNNEIVTDIITIRPKDYLINLLNNQFLTNKRKWYV